MDSDFDPATGVQHAGPPVRQTTSSVPPSVRRSPCQPRHASPSAKRHQGAGHATSGGHLNSPCTPARASLPRAIAGQSRRHKATASSSPRKILRSASSPQHAVPASLCATRHANHSEPAGPTCVAKSTRPPGVAMPTGPQSVFKINRPRRANHAPTCKQIRNAAPGTQDAVRHQESNMRRDANKSTMRRPAGQTAMRH